MSVFVTGDCHGDFRKIYAFADKMELGPNDYIMVLGDMGLFWRHDRRDANYFINDFEYEFDFNLYFVDGNHENFKILNSLPEDENGMGYISKHIRHLKRGCRYEIDGKSILAIGGADSVDQFRRTEGLSWWKEEAITQEDIDKVEPGYYDYVLSHTCPLSVFEANKIHLCTLGNIVDDEEPLFKISNNSLEKLLDKITFNRWCFGHYHVDININEKYSCLYNTFIELK